MSTIDSESSQIRRLLPPLVKTALARVTVAEAETVAARAQECLTADGVLDTMLDAFSSRFGDLLDLESG